MLAKRGLGGAGWQVRKTPYSGDVTDAHNSISIAVDSRSRCWSGPRRGEGRKKPFLTVDLPAVPDLYNVHQGILVVNGVDYPVWPLADTILRLS